MYTFELCSHFVFQVRDKGKWLASFKDVGKYRTNAIGPGMFPSGRNLARSMDHTGSMEQDEKHENGEDENIVEVLQSSEGAVISDYEEVSPFPLERCMRIVPHDQNGGAFFIAVLHKHSPLPGDIYHQSHWSFFKNWIAYFVVSYYGMNWVKSIPCTLCFSKYSFLSFAC